MYDCKDSFPRAVKSTMTDDDFLSVDADSAPVGSRWRTVWEVAESLLAFQATIFVGLGGSTVIFAVVLVWNPFRSPWAPLLLSLALIGTFAPASVWSVKAAKRLTEARIPVCTGVLPLIQSVPRFVRWWWSPVWIVDLAVCAVAGPFLAQRYISLLAQPSIYTVALIQLLCSLVFLIGGNLYLTLLLGTMFRRDSIVLRLIPWRVAFDLAAAAIGLLWLPV